MNTKLPPKKKHASYIKDNYGVDLVAHNLHLRFNIYKTAHLPH